MMKKRSGWIGFRVDCKGRIGIIGVEMFPKIYRTEKLAFSQTYSLSHKVSPPQPVKIEWWE